MVVEKVMVLEKLYQAIQYGAGHFMWHMTQYVVNNHMTRKDMCVKEATETNIGRLFLKLHRRDKIPFFFLYNTAGR